MRGPTSGDIHFTLPGSQDGNCQMCGSAKTKQTNSFTSFYSSDSQASKADDAGTQQGGGMQIVQSFGQLKDKVVSSNGVFRVAPIHGVASKGRGIAEVFLCMSAVPAGAIRPSDP